MGGVSMFQTSRNPKEILFSEGGVAVIDNENTQFIQMIRGKESEGNDMTWTWP